MLMNDLDQLSVNTLRFLAVDAVEKANSGHPGLPLGAVPMAYVLWQRFLHHHPRNPALAEPRPLRSFCMEKLGFNVENVVSRAMKIARGLREFAA